MVSGVDKINDLTRAKIPFIFIIDFKGQRTEIHRLEDAENKRIFFSIGEMKNYTAPTGKIPSFSFYKYPPSYSQYLRAFSRIRHHINRGNTYLLNLTFRSLVKTSLSLWEIFLWSRARYKLFYKNKFVVFSPESFIRIEGDTISTYPMKGTIDAAVSHARRVILKDKKEHAEHATIVDLLRNDLSMVAANVRVKRFRYVEKIITRGKNLLQVSSEIEGKILPRYRMRYGDILHHILPAGSVTGAPKKKTVEIIAQTENYKRGFFTGVFGIFDGQALDSAVMIRFIEETNGKLYFKSGGGITSFSNPRKEYNELVDKIYLPIY